MTYYLVNENTDAIIEASPDRPSRAELLQSAEYFKCPVYLIEGQRVGYTAYPPETAPAPLPVDESAPAVTFAAGCVDYGDKPETAQVDEDGDLLF